MDVKPTVYECNYFAKHGKLPKSLKERRAKAKEEKQQAEEPTKETKDPTHDNVFANLPDDTEFPYHYGGGNYYLSDGSKVSGKQEAVEAQQEIDEE